MTITFDNSSSQADIKEPSARLNNAVHLRLFNTMHEIGHILFSEYECRKFLAYEFQRRMCSVPSSNVCPTIYMDEQQLQKAIEISKTQKLSIHANSKVCESNDLIHLFYRLTGEYSLQSVLLLDLFKFVLVIDAFDLLDQTRFASVHDVVAICVIVIRYILALIRHLFRIKPISYIVQARHRILYIPHSFIHGPGNSDDDHSNSFHTITARLFSSRKGNVLLTPSGPG